MRLGDFNYVLAPLVSFLYTLGGWHWVGIRRIGIPIAIVIWCFLWFRFKVLRNIFLYPITFLTIFGSLTLPLTLIGDSMQSHWFNFFWVYMNGVIVSLALYPISKFSTGEKILIRINDFISEDRWLIGAVIYPFVYGSMAILSSIAHVPHKVFEIVSGLGIGMFVSYILGERNE